MGRCHGRRIVAVLIFVFSLGTCDSAIHFESAWVVNQRSSLNEVPVLRVVPRSDYVAEDKEVTEDLPNVVPYPQQTPHAGRHFLPTHPAYRSRCHPTLTTFFGRRKARRRQAYRRIRRRFFEGWYYRLTLPEEGVSFAFIISIEDPGLGNKSNFTLATIQVVGPEEGYLVQSDDDDTKFWAWEHSQGLGCTFEWLNDDERRRKSSTTAMSAAEWRSTVKSGFQILPTSIRGRVDGHDGTMGGVRDGQGVPGKCHFDFAIRPLSGWGDDDDDEEENDSLSWNKGYTAPSPRQRSTAGWLASYAVFEPHWQVTLADACASGVVVWKGQKFQFHDAPLYAEKNWGGSLPSKWYWTQCNSFDGYPRLSMTAGGGIRRLPFGQREALGMVSVHHNGTFYEGVPWIGDMSWSVAPWGYWELQGRCTSGDRTFEALMIASCDRPGLVFRAPTLDEGMVYFCRDSFEGNMTLWLWELVKEEKGNKNARFVRKMPPIIDGAHSSQGGVEVGGGPWWDYWKGTSRMKQPAKGLVRLPYLLQDIRKRLMGRKKS